MPTHANVFADDSPMVRPTPADTVAAARWKWTSRAWRVLYNLWRPDLREQMLLQIGTTRANKLGPLNTSHNIFKHLSGEQATLYDQAPKLTNSEDQEAVIELSDILTAAVLWPMMQTVQRDAIALREMLIRIDVADGAPVFEPVFPQDVLAYANPADPTRMTSIAHAKLRTDPENPKESIWTWDVLSIEDPEHPVYQVRKDDRGSPLGNDLTAAYLGKPLSGEMYPYWVGEGEDRRPFLPYVLYHARMTGRLFDPRANGELVDGTINLGVDYTNLAHLKLQASWAQRNVSNMRLAGSDVSNAENPGDPIHEVISDPVVVHIWEVIDPEAGQAQFHQWNPPSDPAEYFLSIEKDERSLTFAAGINAADLQRMGGTPQSGYAIAISTAVKRTMQLKYAPVFASSDTELLWKACAMLNLATGSTLPVVGWGIIYTGIPMSPDERKSQREEVTARIDAGLLDPIDGYIVLNPGTTQEQAAAALLHIAQQRRLFTP